MLEFAGPVAGQRVLDVGCGEGRFCRILSNRGAAVVGMDPVVAFLTHARKKEPSHRVVLAGAEAIPFASGAFDLSVSYLTLIDIRNYREAIREMVRVLRPGGRLLAANLNPFVTTRPQAWEKDDRGQYLYVPIDHYFEEKAHRPKWKNIEVVNYHRPMTAYMDAFLETGLRLLRFVEPKPTPAQIAEEPYLEASLRVPFFHVMLWEKPH